MPARAARRRHPVRPGEQDRVAVVGRPRRGRPASRRATAPGMWPIAWTAGALPSGRQRRSRTRIPERPRFSASQSVVARSSGRARPLIVGIIRPWSPPSCPIRRSWRPSATAHPVAWPPGSTSTPGPSGRCPAETAAAMAELAHLRARRRARPPRLLRRVPRADGRGAGGRGGGPRHGRPAPSRLTPLDHGRDEHRDAAARTGGRAAGP